MLFTYANFNYKQQSEVLIKHLDQEFARSTQPRHHGHNMLVLVQQYPIKECSKRKKCGHIIESMHNS
jgi:hypothetical protein